MWHKAKNYTIINGNKRRMLTERVKHELPPIWDCNSKILILGTIPSVKSREVKFYYGHPQNRFWKILELVFNQKIEEKKEFLLKHQIALWDVLESCEIKGSSDSSIQKEKPNPIPDLLQKTQIQAIFTTGKTAHKFYQKYFKNTISILEINLSSPSPANCAKKIEELVEEYKIIQKILEKTDTIGKKEKK